MNGLDASYFQAKLTIIVRDAVYFTPQEMARELVRMAKVADEAEAIKEAAPTTAPDTGELAKLREWAALEEDVDTEWQKGYDAARSYVAMQLAALAPAFAQQKEKP